MPRETAPARNAGSTEFRLGYFKLGGAHGRLVGLLLIFWAGPNARRVRLLMLDIL